MSEIRKRFLDLDGAGNIHTTGRLDFAIPEVVNHQIDRQEPVSVTLWSCSGKTELTCDDLTIAKHVPKERRRLLAVSEEADTVRITKLLEQRMIFRHLNENEAQRIVLRSAESRNREIIVVTLSDEKDKLPERATWKPAAFKKRGLQGPLGELAGSMVGGGKFVIVKEKKA
jgi:hypothetical protein